MSMIRVALLLVIAVTASFLAFAWLTREEVRCGIGEARNSWHSNAALESCAASGVVPAQAYLGMLHWAASDRVAGGPQDWGLDRGLTTLALREVGRQLIEVAANSNDPIAQNELGLAYLDGLYGMPRDPDRALHWLRKADQQGDPLAAYNLARMHQAGHGVAQSENLAEHFLWRSARRGYKDAMCTLAFVRDRDGDRTAAEVLRLASLAVDAGFPCSFDQSDVTAEFRIQE